MKQRTKKKKLEQEEQFLNVGAHVDCGTDDCCHQCDDLDMDVIPNSRWNWWDEGEDKALIDRVNKIREQEETARRKLSYYEAKADLVEEGE
jgi:hypothetical protein